MRWNENDIHNFLKTVGFLQKYSDIKTPARLILKRAVLNQAFSPPANHSNSVGGIYFNDILMDRFVISQTPENNVVVQSRP